MEELSLAIGGAICDSVLLAPSGCRVFCLFFFILLFLPEGGRGIREMWLAAHALSAGGGLRNQVVKRRSLGPFRWLDGLPPVHKDFSCLVERPADNKRHAGREGICKVSR